MAFNLKKAFRNTVLDPNTPVDMLTDGDMHHTDQTDIMRGDATPEQISQMFASMNPDEMGSFGDDYEQAGQLEQQIQPLLANPQIETAIPTMAGNSKPFNLKKANSAVATAAPFPENNFGGGDQFTEVEVGGGFSPEVNSEPSHFETHGKLNEYLLQIDGFIPAYTALMQDIQVNPNDPEGFKDYLRDYYTSLGKVDSNKTENNANKVFNSIYGDPNDMDGNTSMNDSIPVADFTSPSDKHKPNGLAMAKAVDVELQKLAKQIAKGHLSKTASKPFNLKTAQHGSLENVVMYGPEQTGIDIHSGQPISDWHMVEKNKGFGLQFGNIWNIDYESIWRSTIMDKFSAPTQNKEGEWVGGYLQDRFEIDKNVPTTTNMQLKPGQKRKVILPEYGSTESRLQNARSEGEVKGALDTSKPFNWKEASKKKR